VVDISIGHCRDRKALAFAMLCLTFGSILGVICLVSGQIAAGITMLSIFWAIALGSVVSYLAEEYLSEGDDLIVDVCKCAPNVGVTARHDSTGACTVLHRHDRGVQTEVVGPAVRASALLFRAADYGGRAAGRVGRSQAGRAPVSGTHRGR